MECFIHVSAALWDLQCGAEKAELLGHFLLVYGVSQEDI